MTFLKFIGNYMVLFEVKKKQRSFPIDGHMRPAPEEWFHKIAKKQAREKRAKLGKFREEHKDVIDEYFRLML